MKGAFELWRANAGDPAAWRGRRTRDDAFRRWPRAGRDHFPDTWGGLVDVIACVFTASLLKMAVLHYAGLRGYRQVLPFFLGLMLGDFTIGPLWLLIGVASDIPTYVFFL